MSDTMTEATIKVHLPKPGMTIHHIYPLNDLREHETDGKPCWCSPRLEEEESGDILLHNSMDRREEYEQGRKPS